MNHFEVSAKKGDGVEKMFEEVIEILHTKKEDSTGIGTERTEMNS